MNAEFKGLYGPDGRMIAPVEDKRIRVKRAHVIRYLSWADEKKLKALVGATKGKKAERDLVIIETSLNLGLRVSELASLTVGHVRNQDKLTIVGKAEPGGPPKERIIPINKGMQRMFKEFIRHKLQWKESIHDDAPLFVARTGGGMKRLAHEEAFKNWCTRAGFVDAKRRTTYTFHCLRHTFAMRLRERGYSIEQVAVCLERLVIPLEVKNANAVNSTTVGVVDNKRREERGKPELAYKGTW